MAFRDDPRIDRLETLAAHLSHMREAMDILAARQRGNLKREDRAEVERHQAHWRAAVRLLKELRYDERS